jgi:hypothetical protein
VSVSLLKPLFGGFRIEALTWIQKWFKISVGVFKAETTGVVIGICVK